MDFNPLNFLLVDYKSIVNMRFIKKNIVLQSEENWTRFFTTLSNIKKN